jgi:hypothetical protein
MTPIELPENEMAVEREVFIERSTDAFEGMKISWGGVFGGVLAGIGTLMLLSSLGLAIGASAVDPRTADGSQVGTGAAIWTALTLLVSLFVGGWASTRLSMLWERTTAMFEGALVWVLSLVLILYLAASGIGLVAGGMFQVAAPAAAAAAADADGAASGAEAARDDPAGAVAQARESAADLASRAQQSAAQTAARVQPQVSATAWMTFAALVLSLLAAIAGAAVGRRGVARKVAGP